MTRTGKSLVKHGLIAIAGALFGISLTAARPAGAEELRIGFIAPMTGPFAQVGKDMVNGFEMYMDEVKGDFAGATVKFIVEDNQSQAADRRSQGREADPPGPGPHVHWRRPGVDWLCTGAG